MTPEFLDQAEKTAKQFATGFRSLAKLCALASGLGDKKFPKKEPAEQKVPEPAPEIPEPSPEIPKPRSSQDEPTGTWKMLHNHAWILEKSPRQPLDAEIATFLGSRGGCVWGDYFIPSCVRYLVGEEIRSDAYGNQWIRDPAFKKRNGWRPISEEKFDRLASHVQLFVAVVRNTIQEHKSLESFCESVCKVNKYQWGRSQLFLRKDFKMAHFRKWTQKNHKDLKPLR